MPTSLPRRPRPRLALLAFVALLLPSSAAHATPPPDPGNPVGRYNLACKLAVAGDANQAFAWLDKALSTGFTDAATFERDPDLASLHADPRWPALLARARDLAHPCLKLADARQLDFWLGDWEVRDPAGHHVGDSSIQLLLDGCVVYENWTGTLGGSGKSFNFWDKAQKRWQQTWVDDKGGVQQYYGKLDHGALAYTAVDKPSRLTFTPLPDGRVRQLSERTDDGGKHWVVNYDFVYARKKTPPR
jgi:hypothetical protein